ncbi:hypothetical protein [Nostoc sp.]|uniref:hypothetical protein n=1 Tax=Nostoc sp. TaxID=1180 RepID=UPI002FFBFE65
MMPSVGLTTVVYLPENCCKLTPMVDAIPLQFGSLGLKNLSLQIALSATVLWQTGYRFVNYLALLSFPVFSVLTPECLIGVVCS